MSSRAAIAARGAASRTRAAMNRRMTNLRPNTTYSVCTLWQPQDFSARPRSACCTARLAVLARQLPHSHVSRAPPTWLPLTRPSAPSAAKTWTNRTSVSSRASVGTRCACSAGRRSGLRATPSAQLAAPSTRKRKSRSRHALTRSCTCAAPMLLVFDAFLTLPLPCAATLSRSAAERRRKKATKKAAGRKVVPAAVIGSSPALRDKLRQMRVVQRNLVYVVGLPLDIAKETVGGTWSRRMLARAHSLSLCTCRR